MTISGGAAMVMMTSNQAIHNRHLQTTQNCNCVEKVYSENFIFCCSIIEPIVTVLLVSILFKLLLLPMTNLIPEYSNNKFAIFLHKNIGKIGAIMMIEFILAILIIILIPIIVSMIY